MTDEQLVPLFPRFDVTLKQRLGLIISRVFGPVLLRDIFQSLSQIAESRLVLGEVFSSRDRIDQGGD